MPLRSDTSQKKSHDLEDCMLNKKKSVGLICKSLSSPVLNRLKWTQECEADNSRDDAGQHVILVVSYRNHRGLAEAPEKRTSQSFRRFVLLDGPLQRAAATLSG